MSDAPHGFPDSGSRLTEYPAELLARLFDQVSDGVVVFDADGRVVSCNSAMALITGRSIEQLIGTVPADWGGHVPWCSASSTLTSSEGWVLQPDGRVRRVMIKGFTMPGEPEVRAAVYRDVTRRHRPDYTPDPGRAPARHLLENVNDGIMVHRDGLIVYVNERLASMLGYERGSLLMKPAAVLHLSSDLGSIPATGDAPTRYNSTCRRRDGTALDVEVAVSTSLYDGQEAVFEVLRDVTERTRAERRAAAFLTLGQMLNLASTPREAADAVLRTADDLLQYDACILQIIEKPGAPLVPILYMDTINGVRVEVTPPRAATGQLGTTERVLCHGPRLLLRKTQEEGENSEYLPFGNPGRRSLSLMFVPIRSPGGTVGVLSLQSYQPNAYTSADLDVLQGLADYCSGAMERTRAVAQLRESEERYRQIFQGNSAIQLLVDPRTGSILDANATAEVFYGCTRAQLCAASVFFINETSGEELWTWMKEAVETHTPSRAFRHRVAGGALRDVEVHSGPVTAHGRTLLHCIVQDVTERNRAVARGHAITELGHRLSAATSPTEVGRVALDIARRLIGWDACFINLLTSDLDCSLPGGKLLVPVIHFDTIDGDVREVIPACQVLPGGSVCERTIREGPQLILRSREESAQSGFSRFGNTGSPSASLMFVPVHGSSGVIGVMSLQSYCFDAYTQEHLELLQTLADHCSGALERTRTEELVRLLESAVRLATDFVVISALEPGGTGEARIIFANEAFIRHTGWARSELLGQPVSVLFGALTEAEHITHLETSLSEGHPVNLETVNYRRDGTSYDVEFTAYPICDSHGTPRYFVSVQRDVTERRQKQRQLAWRAFHDPLTGLPNRSLFTERLEHALARHRRSCEEQPFAVLYLDLDSFKEVNDRYGHAAGDQVLVQVARRLEACVRPGDTVARLGGDEFIILLEDVGSLENVECIARRILSAFQEPICLGDVSVSVGASIGVMPPASSQWEPGRIVGQADAALYLAKGSGKGCYRIASV